MHSSLENDIKINNSVTTKLKNIIKLASNYEGYIAGVIFVSFFGFIFWGFFLNSRPVPVEKLKNQTPCVSDLIVESMDRGQLINYGNLDSMKNACDYIEQSRKQKEEFKKK